MPNDFSDTGRQWPTASGASGAEPPTLSLIDLVPVLKRSFWTITATLLIAVTLGGLYVMTTPRSFVASAQLMIEPAKQRLLWQNSSVVDLTVDNAQVESQVEVLRSERIANDVIATLGLANDPEFRSRSGAARDERQRVALGRFMDAQNTRRVGQSYVIEVSFRSLDPAKAARITNAIIAAYKRDELRARTEVVQQSSQWMQDRVTQLGVELNAAAAAVQKFRAANGIVDNGSDHKPRLLDKLTELEARAEAYRKLYEGFVQRLTENEQQASYPVTNVRVIAAASTELVRAYPKKKLIMALAVLLGLLLGGAIAAARAMLDGHLRTPRQVRDVLGLTCLASLPRLPDRSKKQRAGGAYQAVLAAPRSPFAEAMRQVKVSLQNAFPEEGPIHIGILSLLPGEGKSTVAANLAALFAASGSPTLLIDADSRRASLSRWLAPGARRGLIEALAGEADGIVPVDRGANFHFLPLVGGDGVSRPAELLVSPAAGQLLRHLAGPWETVIVDLPALRSAGDARALGRSLDGCVLVGEWGRVPLEAVREAVALLRADRVRLLGAVINKVEEGIPPLFGLHLADLRGSPQEGYVSPAVQVGSR